MSEMCSVCAAADSCPYFGQDSYYWNERGEDRCDEIIASVLDKSRWEYLYAWMDYIKEDDN